MVKTELRIVEVQDTTSARSVGQDDCVIIISVESENSSFGEFNINKVSSKGAFIVSLINWP